MQDQFGDVSGATLADETWTISCIAGASKDFTMLRAADGMAAITSDAVWAERGVNAWTVYPSDTFIDGSGAAFDAVSGGASSCGPAIPPDPQPPPLDPYAVWLRSYTRMCQRPRSQYCMQGITCIAFAASERELADKRTATAPPAVFPTAELEYIQLSGGELPALWRRER